MTTPDDTVWRYTRRGTVRHALRYDTDWAALCDAGPQFTEDWYGTGSQQEYERCASLPPCQRCIARGAPAGPLHVT